MSGQLSFARVMVPVFVLMVAILMNNTRIIQIDAPFVAYQIQLLGKSMFVCPNRPARKAECGRWLGYLTPGSSV